MDYSEKIAAVRASVEDRLVSISDLAREFTFVPDLRVDPRLRAALVEMYRVAATDEDMAQYFPPDFKLPVTRCYAPFNPLVGKWEEADTLDSADPRGHEFGLAIDIDWQKGMNADQRAVFHEIVAEVGLKRIHEAKRGEWWHHSKKGSYPSSWRPNYVVSGGGFYSPGLTVAELWSQVVNGLGIVQYYTELWEETEE